VHRTAGLSSAIIVNLQSLRGLNTSDESSLTQYSDLFSNSTITGLEAGEIAQVGWYVTSPTADPGRVSISHHAFLIGRFNDGDWFLSDQGPKPAAEFAAGSLIELQADVEAAVRRGDYWLFIGTLDRPVFGWTGVRLLGGPEGVGEKRGDLIAVGTHLAQVDAGALTIGDDIEVEGYVGSYNSLSEAHFAAGGVGDDHGVAIIEMPSDAYLV